MVIIVTSSARTMLKQRHGDDRGDRMAQGDALCACVTSASAEQNS